MKRIKYDQNMHLGKMGLSLYKIIEFYQGLVSGLMDEVKALEIKKVLSDDDLNDIYYNSGKKSIKEFLEEVDNLISKSGAGAKIEVEVNHEDFKNVAGGKIFSEGGKEVKIEEGKTKATYVRNSPISAYKQGQKEHAKTNEDKEKYKSNRLFTARYLESIIKDLCKFVNNLRLESVRYQNVLNNLKKVKECEDSVADTRAVTCRYFQSTSDDKGKGDTESKPKNIIGEFKSDMKKIQNLAETIVKFWDTNISGIKKSQSHLELICK